MTLYLYGNGTTPNYVIPQTYSRNQIRPASYLPLAYSNNSNLNIYNPNINNRTIINTNPKIYNNILSSPFINGEYYLKNNSSSVSLNKINNSARINNLNNLNHLNPLSNHTSYNPNKNQTVANVIKLPPSHYNVAYNNNNINNLTSRNQLNQGNNLNKNNILINQPRNNIKRSVNIDPNIDVDNKYRNNNLQNNTKIKTGYNNINNANAVVENDLTNPNKKMANNKMNAVVENNLIPKNMNNMNNINQKAVEEINLGGPKNNIRNNIKTPDKNNNFATVKKITDTTSNATSNATLAKVKRRDLTAKDYDNIIYKEVGIINLGNTCFYNSCLQVLIHCPLFIYSFFKKHILIRKESTPISYAFFELCQDMMQIVDQQPNKYIDISNFKNEFGSKHSIFDGYLQNDSQEFFRFLLEDISTELNEATNKTIYRALTNSDTTKTKQFRDIEFDKNFSEREKSIVTDLFYAQLITTFTCQCTHNTYSFQKILDFPLLLPENTPNVNIYDLLIKYFQAEYIDFERKCEKCQKKIKHKKETKISRPPKLLILSFQRIDPVSQKKNECVVTFPKILKINEFIEKDIGNDNRPTYELFAVVNHQGTVDFGHYFSYIKFYRKEDWYEFNDSQVKYIGKNIESFPYAYALFYAKR